ncbi:hypothetical protein SAMN05421736_112123 [Evansella caseinilytica]|uniref:Uncharacterized protein n=1 Tax=Evansella caseinilytica TaxID=1503961 RepID=A0A1H3SY75_9BACI|nr:hypothetical protein [Evansella caseinilytica]SDZ42884.1 hypothetical protein SAMN05421736_112123 [Evansella caseinilytica]
MINGDKKSKILEAFDEYGPVTPQQIAVIIGLVTKVLRVRAVVLDVEQNIEIILEGSLVKNNNLKKLANQINEENLQEWLLALQEFRSNNSL